MRRDTSTSADSGLSTTALESLGGLVSNRGAALLRIARQLGTRASESRTGGWSTHQVQPMRELASEIRHAVATGDYSRLRAVQP